MPLFTHTISNWESWGAVYQNLAAWLPLMQHIYQKEGLPFAPPGHLTPGTNAVFRVGNTVCKIFAPAESGVHEGDAFATELFGLSHAQKRGVPAPRLLANGCVQDRYTFFYLVMDFLDAPEVIAVQSGWTDNQKYAAGKALRALTSKLNVPCGSFNGIDVIERAKAATSWQDFPQSFLAQRQAFLQRYRPAQLVFTHGDFNPDNLLVDAHGTLYAIDFADSVLAPPAYELAALVCEAFDFEAPYLRGFFGEGYPAAEIAGQCAEVLLLHDFGEDMIARKLGNPQEITSIAVLKKQLLARLAYS